MEKIRRTRRFKSIKMLDPICQKAKSSKKFGPGPFWFEGPKILIIKDFCHILRISHSSIFRIYRILKKIAFIAFPQNAKKRFRICIEFDFKISSIG